MSRQIINAQQAMSSLESNIQKITVPVELRKYLLTCEKAQDVLDALESCLENEYNQELDWLYSTFFTKENTRILSFN